MDFPTSPTCWMPSGEKIPWFIALFKNSTLAGSINMLVKGSRLWLTSASTPALIRFVRAVTRGVIPSIARMARMAPRMPREKLFTSISNPAGICPSISLSNFLITHAAIGPTTIAPRNMGLSEATITPIDAIAPITPPRSPATTLPPV